MGEALNGLKRTMMCGEPREINVGEKITLMEILGIILIFAGLFISDRDYLFKAAGTVKE